MTSNAPVPTVVGHSGALSMLLPEPWESDNPRPEIELFAVMPLEAGNFTPSLVATVNPFAGDIAEFSVAAVRGLTSTLAECRVLDVSGWEAEPAARPAQWVPLETPTSLDRRSISYTHRAPNGRLVSGRDFLLVAQGWAVQISTTCTVQDRTPLDEYFEPMAASVQVLRPAPAADAAPQAPQLDELASWRYDATLESLAEARPRGGYPVPATYLSGYALAKLADPRAPFSRRARKDAAWAELIDEGLAGADGLSETGAVVAKLLWGSELRFRLTSAMGVAETTQQIFLGDDAALVLSQPGYAQVVGGAPWHDGGSEYFDVELVSTTELASRMLAWAGVGPGWPLPVSPALVDPQSFNARVAGSADAPVGADRALEAVWSQEWFCWNVVGELGDQELVDASFVNAGERGSYRVGLQSVAGSDAPAAVMVPVPGAFIAGFIEDCLQAGLHRRPPRWA